MVKNSRIHLPIETTLKNELRKQAKDLGISLSQLVSDRIGGSPRLLAIEMKVDKIEIMIEELASRLR